MWLEAIGGRKYSLGLFTLILAFVLALIGKLTAEFSGIAVIVNGAFNYSNMKTTTAGLQAAAATTKEDA